MAKRHSSVALSQDQRFLDLIATNASLRSISRQLQVPETTVRTAYRIATGNSSTAAQAARASLAGLSETQQVAEQVAAVLRKAKGRVPVNVIADKLDISPRRVREAVGMLADERILAHVDGDHAAIRPEPLSKPPSTINTGEFFGESIRFGALGDCHLGSRYERLDAMEAMYDIYEREGITTVYHTGNFIDGEARFNRNDLLVHGMDNQLRYFAEKYPRRKGITTHFIAGDDHEGWYTQREGIDIGSHAEHIARQCGRDDLVYLGYMEHDIILKAADGECMLRVVHPGGGSAYAISYTTQKLVESLSGGEKPAIMLIGHYHKAEYIYYRNIHSVQTGAFQDQTPFMRKKRLSAHVGGWIIEANQAEDGSINRFKTEFVNFFDKAYYRPWKYQQ